MCWPVSTSKASHAVHLLFLGYSSIVRRRVLPAARSVAAIRRISVASRSQGRDGAEARAERGQRGRSLVSGLRRSPRVRSGRPGLRLGGQRGPRGVGDACSPPRLPRHRGQAGVPGSGDRRSGGRASRGSRTGAWPRRRSSCSTRRRRRCARSSIRQSRVSPAPPPRSRFRRCRRATSATAPTAGAGASTTSAPTPPRRTGCCSAPRRTACTAPSSRGTPHGTPASTRRSACC